MKKTILSIAFVAAGLFASTAFASNPSQNCENCQSTCSVAKGQKGEKGDRKHHRKGQRDEMAAFEGINLTDAQKTSIQKLHADRQAAREAARSSNEKSAQRPDRRQARLDYFKAVSVILTPDQYITFLENSAAGQPKVAKAGKPGRRGDKARDNKGQRGERKNGKHASQPTNQQS